MKRILVLSVFVVGILLFSTQVYANGYLKFKFWADEDSFITKYYGCSNYGSWQHLKVRDVDSESCPDRLSRTLIKFSDEDLSSLSGLEIISASLHLYEYRRTTSSTSDEINLFRVTQDWTEDSVTWNNQPDHAAQRITRRVFTKDDKTPGWRGWYGLANLVDWWVTGEKANYGIILENDEDGVFGQMNVRFHSSEYLDGTSIRRPYLKITATPEPFSAVLFGIGAGFLGLCGAYRRRKI